MKCPKCKQARIVGVVTPFHKYTSCPACGLYYEPNGSKESLRKQIYGELPVRATE
jgi:ribosomal protein S27E